MSAIVLDQQARREMGVWVLQGVVAGAFLAAGVTKVVGISFEVHQFEAIGLGQWFRVVTGIVQISGAIALLYPRLAPIGALWLSLTMLSAAVASITALHTSPLPAIAVGMLTALLVYLRREALAHRSPPRLARC